MENAGIFVFIGLLMIAIFMVLVEITIPQGVIDPSYRLVILAVAFFFDLMAFSSRFYGYLFLPVLKQRKRHIVLSNEDAYWLSTTGDSILHKEGDMFTSTIYIKIPLYISATEMGETEKMEFTRQCARVVCMSHDPIRFTSQMNVMNKDDYLKTIRDTIGEVENKEALIASGVKTDESEDRVKGKASMWHHMFDRISGTASFEMITYASVSGKGSKEFEAISAAQARSRDAMSAIGSIFGVPPSIVTGEALLKFVEPEYLIPYSTISEQITKQIREQVS